MKVYQFLKSVLQISLVVVGSIAFAAQAGTVAIATGAVGTDTELLRKQLDIFEQRNPSINVEVVTMPASTTDQFGQYKIWLSARSSDIDIYRVDVIWAPQIDNHLIDLSGAVSDVIGDHFPAIVESQTVNGRLVALPFFTDAPALYYRKDLLDKYGKSVPENLERTDRHRHGSNEQGKSCGELGSLWFRFPRQCL